MNILSFQQKVGNVDLALLLFGRCLSLKDVADREGLSKDSRCLFGNGAPMCECLSVGISVGEDDDPTTHEWGELLDIERCESTRGKPDDGALPVRMLLMVVGERLWSRWQSVW